MINEYLEELAGNDQAAHTLDFNLEDHGYKLVPQIYENGFYGGQNDHPKYIAAALREVGIDNFIFHIGCVGQFDMRFSVYVREDEYDLLPLNLDPKKAEDPAELLKKNLETAEMRTISAQEFVEGTWR